MWCLCRRIFSHGFLISCHLLAEPNQSVCSPSSSTHHGTPPVDPFTSSSSTHSYQSRGDYYFSQFHAVFPSTFIIPLLVFPHTPPLPLFCLPHPPPSWIFFWTWPPKLRPLHPPVCGLSHVALLNLFVLSAAERERPEQNARLLLAASTSPSGPPSAPPYVRL